MYLIIHFGQNKAYFDEPLTKTVLLVKLTEVNQYTFNRYSGLSLSDIIFYFLSQYKEVMMTLSEKNFVYIEIWLAGFHQWSHCVTQFIPSVK